MKLQGDAENPISLQFLNPKNFLKDATNKFWPYSWENCITDLTFKRDAANACFWSAANGKTTRTFLLLVRKRIPKNPFPKSLKSLWHAKDWLLACPGYPHKIKGQIPWGKIPTHLETDPNTKASLKNENSEFVLI